MSSLAAALRLYQQERYDEAAPLLREICGREPDNVQAWMYYGAALGHCGQWREAVRALREVVRLQPDQPAAYCDLGGALCELEDFGAAVDATDAALALEADYPAALRLRSRIRSATARARPPAELTTAEVVERRQAAADHFALPPPTPQTESRWLPWLLGLLALLLLISGIRFARRPGEMWRRLHHAEALLDLADQHQAQVARSPGEDFDEAARIRALRGEADTLLRALPRRAADEPEFYLLRARLEWATDHGDALTTRNDLMQALALLGSLPDDAPRRTGHTVRELRAAVYRLRAEVNVSAARGPSAAERLQDAAQDLQTAHELAPDPADNDLAARLERRLRALPR